MHTSGMGPANCKLLSVHGVPSRVYFGQDRTHGVNMVGKSWLDAAGAVLIADYRNSGCLLLRSDDIPLWTVSKNNLPQPLAVET